MEAIREGLRKLILMAIMNVVILQNSGYVICMDIDDALHENNTTFFRYTEFKL